MGALRLDQPDAALRVAERDQLLAEHLDADRRAIELRELAAQRHRLPVAPEILAHRRTGGGTGQQLVVGRAQHRGLIAYMPPMRALLLCFLVAAAPAVLAQSDYPNRPIRLIVTVPPGGAADFIARLVGAKLSGLAQPVLVENRGGAGGTLAADAVAKAPADGYTLLQNSITTHGVGPHLYARLPYDPVKDFAPVSGLALLPLIMAVTADLPARSIQELVVLSRTAGLNFASSGNGGAPHMAAELFKSVTGAPITSRTRAALAVVGGRQIMFDAAPSLIQHVRSGKLRVLAAASRSETACCPRRRPSPSSATRRWRCRSGTACSYPPARLVRPSTGSTGKRRGCSSRTMSGRSSWRRGRADAGAPEAFASFMRDEMAKWAPVVKQAGVKLD